MKRGLFTIARTANQSSNPKDLTRTCRQQDRKATAIMQTGKNVPKTPSNSCALFAFIVETLCSNPKTLRCRTLVVEKGDGYKDASKIKPRKSDTAVRAAQQIILPTRKMVGPTKHSTKGTVQRNLQKAANALTRVRTNEDRAQIPGNFVEGDMQSMSLQQGYK